MAAPDKDPARIAGMFDSIAPRYDLLNRVLSLGLDQRWRQRGVAELRLRGRSRILDLCAGTADLAIAVVGRQADVSVVGVDFSGAMLQRGQEKVRRARLEERIHLVRGDATRIPLPDGACDGATIGF